MNANISTPEPNRISSVRTQRNSRIKSTWKSRLAAVGLGSLTLAIVFTQTIMVSNDVRLMYASGALLLFGSAFWLGRQRDANYFDAILLCLPVFAVFIYSVLDTMPVLWPCLLLWSVATGAGFAFRRVLHGKTTLGAGVLIALLASSIWYCGSYVPEQLEHLFRHFGNASAPGFMLQSVGDRSAVLAPKPGKILVIDFFSTTCVPCIAELPEIAAVRAELSQNRDIDFVLVASDRGNDTPERFRSFAQKRHITIPLAFDPAGKVHGSFGLKGIPALVVLDRTGRVRLTREGYNPAETSFRRDLVEFLKSL